MSDLRVSVVILAGGRSSRFGRDKLAEPIDGRTLLTHVIDAVRPVASEIIVVGAPGSNVDVAADVRVIHDPVAFEGPLAGARAGFELASESIVLVVGGDMPDLVPAVLESMVAALRGFDVVVLEHDGHPRPLPIATWREAALEAADRLLRLGERSLRALVGSLPAHVIPESTWRPLDPDARTLLDIDTEADLP
jgi:molybdopterin-guanine dinucleotide biosynthesis protein A